MTAAVPETPRPADTPDVVSAMAAAHAALDGLATRDCLGRVDGWASLDGAPPEVLAEAVRLQARLEARVAALRLHTVAAAETGDAAASVAAAHTAAWAAQAAGKNRGRSWGSTWLANRLRQTYPATRAALAQGRISEEHAAIIVKAAESAPEDISAADLAKCERLMVAKAETLPPQRLRRAVRRLLAPLSKELADAHQEKQLRDQERRAEAETWMTLSDNGDGTWTGRFTIPELHGQALRKTLETLSSPRRHNRSNNGQPVQDPTIPGMGHRLSWTEHLGAAFVELLEHLPTTGHARTGINLVVHGCSPDTQRAH